MESIQTRAMREAIAASRWGMENDKGGPFGAAVIRDGSIIASTYNRVTSTDDPTAHAEVHVIRMACDILGTYDLSDCELVTSCEPCPMCFGAIYWARFKKVYYSNTKADAAEIGFDDSFIYEELAKPMAERSIPFERINIPDARQVFDDWKLKEDKAEY